MLVLLLSFSASSDQKDHVITTFLGDGAVVTLVRIVLLLLVLALSPLQLLAPRRGVKHLRSLSTMKLQRSFR